MTPRLLALPLLRPLLSAPLPTWEHLGRTISVGPWLPPMRGCMRMSALPLLLRVVLRCRLGSLLSSMLREFLFN